MHMSPYLHGSYMDVSIEIKKHHSIDVKCYIGIAAFYRYTANGGHSGYKNNVRNTLILGFFLLVSSHSHQVSQTT